MSPSGAREVAKSREGRNGHQTNNPIVRENQAIEPLSAMNRPPGERRLRSRSIQGEIFDGELDSGQNKEQQNGLPLFLRAQQYNAAPGEDEPIDERQRRQ